jgi:hypothetical protein
MNYEAMYTKGLYELSDLTKSKMNPWMLEAYVEIFRGRYEDGIKALKVAFMKTRSNSPMPSPADLLSFVGETTPQAITARDEANEMAGMIIKAVTKFGWPNAKAAKEFLGDDGWRIVEMSGGWSTICDMDVDQLPSWRAQLRELSEAVTKKQHFGLPTLEAGNQTKQIESIVNALSEAKGI